MDSLSWASVLLVSALTVVGCVQPYQGAPYTQGYGGGGTYYAPPPQNPYATPWVGANTPWVFYQGDWFLNGMLYHNYGNQYGWAPYYAYPSTYIVRPNNWYEPKWNTWYQQNHQYQQSFTQQYPYWRDHHTGQRYDQNFYNRYHRGQGEGWERGFQGRAFERPQSERPRPGSGQINPREGQRPGSGQLNQRERQRPGPSQVTPREGQRPGPSQVTPREGQRPGPAQMNPPEGRRPGTPQMAPREPQRSGPAKVAPQGQRPGPARVAPPEGQRSGPARVAPPERPRPNAAQVTPRERPRPGSGQGTPPEGPRPGPGEERH